MKMRDVRTKAEVEIFLNRFFPKMDIWGIFFLNRDKNQNALTALGIVPEARERYIRELTADDYVETIASAMAFGDMWVFGRDINSREVYIKISLGNPDDRTICISFHEAESHIRYVYKRMEDEQ